MTKETAVVLPGFAIGWTILELIMQRRIRLHENRNVNLASDVLLASTVGIAIYLVWRHNYLPFGLTERGYAARFDLGLGRVMGNFRIWIDILIRDFLYLVPALALVGYLVLRKRDLVRGMRYVIALAWMGLWVALYLPWSFTQEYYLLPLAAGAAFLGGMAFDDLRALAASGRCLERIAGWAIGACSAGLFLLALPGFLTNARFQLALDEANMVMLEYVVKEAPIGSAIYINIQERNEYVDKLRRWIAEIYGREDLLVDNFTPKKAGLLREAQGPVMLIAPIFRNQFYPSVRVGVYEHTAKEWNSSMHELLADRLKEIHRVEASIRAWIIDTPRLICPLVREISYCRVLNTPLDRRLVSYGWI